MSLIKLTITVYRNRVKSQENWEKTKDKVNYITEKIPCTQES